MGMLIVGALFSMPFFTFLGMFYKDQLDEKRTEKFKLSEKVTTWNNILSHVPNEDISKVITCKSGCCTYILPTSTEDEHGK